MKEPENNGPSNGVRLGERVGMSLPGDHDAKVRGMPDCRDETYRRAQA